MPPDPAAAARAVRSPDALVCELEDCCVGYGGLESVQLAAGRTRGQAAARYADEVGEHFTDVRCRVRHIRVLTRQEVWDRIYDEGPDAAGPVPEGWEPYDDMPAWTIADRADPRSHRVYICTEFVAASKATGRAADAVGEG